MYNYRSTIFVKREIEPRLRSRLNLGETPDVSNPLLLVRQIVPIVNVDALLRTTKAGAVTVNISTAGEKTLFTVPSFKNWYLWKFTKYATTQTPELYLFDKDGNPAWAIEAPTGYTIYDFYGVVINEGWTFRCEGGQTGDTGIPFRLLYEEEELY